MFKTNLNINPKNTELALSPNTLSALKKLKLILKKKNYKIQSGQIPRYGATAFLISEDILFIPLLASIISQV